MEEIKVINDNILSIFRHLVFEYNLEEPIKIQRILYFLYLDYVKENRRDVLFWEDFTIGIEFKGIEKIQKHISNHGLSEKWEENGKIYQIEILNDDKKIEFIKTHINKYLELTTSQLSILALLTRPWSQFVETSNYWGNSTIITKSDIDLYAQELWSFDKLIKNEELNLKEKGE